MQNDLISRQAAIDAVYKDLPPAQPEIIDCGMTFDEQGYRAVVQPEHYCGYAERREDD